MSTDDCGLRYALERAITKAHVHKDEIGIVMMTAAGVVDVDALETSVLQSFFADVPSKPVLASTTAIWGNLMEAGGLAEIGVVAAAYRAGEWPSGMMIRSIDANQKPMKSIDAKRPIAAILRSSPWGEYSVLLVRCEPADAHAIKG